MKNDQDLIIEYLKSQYNTDIVGISTNTSTTSIVPTTSSGNWSYIGDIISTTNKSQPVWYNPATSTYKYVEQEPLEPADRRYENDEYYLEFIHEVGGRSYSI